MALNEVLPVMQLAAFIINGVLVLLIVPLRKSIDKLQENDEGLANRIQRLEVKVAENYIQRGEVTVSLNSIVTKLDRIEARMDGRIEQLEASKADK
jgi:hypothetical protein